MNNSFQSVDFHVISFRLHAMDFPLIKPFYISFMWTLSTVILPCVLYERNLSILMTPGDYIPCLLTLFATSNIADVKDIEEDRYNNINTLPVQYGELTTTYVILLCLALSSFLFGIHHNYTVHKKYSQ